MMKAVLAFVCLLLAAGSVSAQNYGQAVRQADRVSAQNNAEQERVAREAGGAGGPAAAGGSAAPAAPDPALAATLQNIAGLQSDFAALKTAGKPDADSKTALLNDLSQAAKGSKPSANTVKKLAEDLSTAVTGATKLAAPQQQKLAQLVHALFNSSHLSATQQQTLLDGVQKILTDGGASLNDVVDVTVDLKAVVSETK
jgi:hypothetical protein